MKLISIKDFEIEFIEKSANFLNKCTIQLFRNNSEEGLVPHGCGILFSFQNYYFLISAAHNFADEPKNDIKLRIGNEIKSIQKSELKFSLETGDLEKDKIDTAVLQIKDKTLISLLKKENEFIDIQDIELDHKQKILNLDSSVESYLYILYGYPAKQSKPKFNSEFEWVINALYLQGMLVNPKDKTLEKGGYTNHVVIDKLKKGKKYHTGERVNLPIFKGMSGCGLWDIQGFDIKRNKLRIKLVGIFIEIGSNLAISTKIDFAIEVIRYKFGCKKLPSSTHLKNMKKR